MNLAIWLCGISWYCWKEQYLAIIGSWNIKLCCTCNSYHDNVNYLSGKRKRDEDEEDVVENIEGTNYSVFAFSIII